MRSPRKAERRRGTAATSAPRSVRAICCRGRSAGSASASSPVAATFAGSPRFSKKYVGARIVCGTEAARSRRSMVALLSKCGTPVWRSALATEARISQGIWTSLAAAMSASPWRISSPGPAANGVVTA
jgi:hypothetical protein